MSCANPEFFHQGGGEGGIFSVFLLCKLKKLDFSKTKGGGVPLDPLIYLCICRTHTIPIIVWFSFELRELFMFITLLESTKQTESHGSSAFAQLLRNSIPFNSITRSLLSHSRGNYNSVPKIKPTRMPSHSIGRVNARFNGKFG